MTPSRVQFHSMPGNTALPRPTRFQKERMSMSTTQNSELNPNHPVTMAVSDQWHKIVALLMYQRGETEVEIPVETIARFA